MSQRFSDVIFLIAPFHDARFKLLWLDNLDTLVKLRVLEQIRSAFVHYFSKVNLCVLQHMEADVPSTTEHNIAIRTRTAQLFFAVTARAVTAKKS